MAVPVKWTKKEKDEILESLSRKYSWQLWRQDDNGNRVLMAEFIDKDAAEDTRREYEAKGHKQFYWVQPTGQQTA